MEIRELTPFLSVSPQIAERDLAAVAALGFKGVIGNRPDKEEDTQPASAAIAAAAERAGLAYRHIPVVSGKVTDADVEAFAAAVAEMRGPILAFCRTGTRSTTLWALSQAPHIGADAILRIAAAAKYDLNVLRPRLEARAAAGPAMLRNETRPPRF